MLRIGSILPTLLLSLMLAANALAQERVVDGWLVMEEVNPLTDAVDAYIVMGADPRVSNIAHFDTFLVIECLSEVLHVSIVWVLPYEDDTSVFMQTRIGDAEAQSEAWGLASAGGESMVTYYLGDNVDLVEQLLTADRFVAAIHPSRSIQQLAVFDITGMTEAIVPVIDACAMPFARHIN